jgi:hypothetical protein
MKLEYRQFGGMRPAVDPRVLNKQEALDTLDGDLRYMTVNPFLQPDPSELAGATLEPLGYLAAGESEDGSPVNHLHDTLHYRNDVLVEGLYEVNERGTYIAASAVAQDAHERVYFSRPGGGMYDRGRTDGADPVEERTVGVPAPVDPDLIRDPIFVGGRIVSELGYTFTWRYYIEQVGSPFAIDEEGALDQSKIVVTSTPDVFDDVTLTYTYNVAEDDPTHPFYNVDPAAFRFIMYAEMTSATGRFLGTVFPSPSARATETDAYVGGSLAAAQMGPEDTAPVGIIYYCDVRFAKASDEYSTYRSYVFTYVTDRGDPYLSY